MRNRGTENGRGDKAKRKPAGCTSERGGNEEITRTATSVAEMCVPDRAQKEPRNMIATLDSFRDTLEDFGGGLGVTDPVSGPVVLTLK